MTTPSLSARILAGGPAFLLTAAVCAAQAVFINEIHYDNNSSDTGEGVEIAGPAGTDLSDFDLVFYNGNNPQAAVEYATVRLSGVLPDAANGSGFAWFGPPANGIQNGGNDGVALYRRSTGQVEQLLSYEGVFTASNGVAAGQTSVDIGVAESSTSPAGQSLQLAGAGTLYQQFHWVASQTATPGQINGGQTFGSGGAFSSVLTVAPASVREDADSSAATGTLVLTPAPASPVLISLSSSDVSEVTVPPTVEVPVSGTVAFPLTAVMDGIADGNQPVTVTASDAAGNYPLRQASLVVVDVDEPPPPFTGGTIRVATFNVLMGVGAPGSPEFLAVKAVLRQINADVIAFQEVSDAGGFADLKALLGELGFQTSRTFLATDGDAHAGQPFSSGDFGSGAQSLALASRFPITQTVQIGRGAAGRKELTRYPLFVRVDVPNLPSQQDPAFVVVHLKANGSFLASDPLADQFRRGIEAWRITEFLQQNGWDGAARNLFVLGDCNQNAAGRPPLSFATAGISGGHVFADGTALPASYLLGSDLADGGGTTLVYDSADALFPNTAFAGIHLASPETRQADGATASFNTSGNARLDYLFASSSTVSEGLAAVEIYNSRLEPGFDGLPKRPDLPEASASFTASDHFAVFGDFALSAMPRLSLTPSVPLVDEAAAPATVAFTLSLSQAPATPLSIHFSTARPGRIRLPIPTLILPAGQLSASVPVEVLQPPDADPHRVVTVSAAAEGWFSAAASLEIRNLESAGGLIITQYVEPSSGSEPKAVEILNRTGTLLDFATSPLKLRRFSNGDAIGEYEARIVFGHLENGQAVVVGGAPAGEYLLAQGIIVSNNGVTPQSAPNGTPFFNAAGNLRYWKDSFTYNGNDALEVLLNFTRQDVFGVIGSDPGSSWTGSGVSTANQNIALRGNIATGSQGFTDPSSRFLTVSSGDALDGFGLPPVVNDPYLDWIQAAGLGGSHTAPLEDADGDGRRNLLEYALLLNPANADGSEIWLMSPPPGAVFSLRRRMDEPGLRTILRSSMDLQTWTPQIPANMVSHGDGTETISTSPSPNPRQFFRLEVRRE